VAVFSPRVGRRRKRPAEKFTFDLKSNINFSVLKEHGGATSEACLIELSDLEEFPDFHELVRDGVRSAGEADESLVSRASESESE
jgi:hypothetical protein